MTDQAELLESVRCGSQPLGISFHPSSPLVAAGLVDGSIEFHKYFSSEEGKGRGIVRHVHNRGSSARSTCFISDGDQLLSAGGDGNLVGIDSVTLKKIWDWINYPLSIFNKNIND